ncbi:MAG: NAD(P)H-hydrate dehydratase [Gammaproteobacteria bacterium]|nr:NAD(P)H-hydrate dehydratase [Gammaproteobacteria bacterium]
MSQLFTAAQCRELDRLAIAQHVISWFELMERAGRATFRALLDRWPEAKSVSVVCGKGNNAGDGYIVAGLAREIGMRVQLCQLGSASVLTGDAGRARDWALSLGVAIEPLADQLVGDVIVDALLGTGLTGSLREPFGQAVRLINKSAGGVISVDIPTGVSSDNGAVIDDAVRADVTTTFIGRKIGLYTGPGVSYCGDVLYEDLHVPPEIFRAIEGCPMLSFPTLGAHGYRFPRRDPNVYKQALGHAVVVGGDYSMGGAPLMAAETALRMGAGMVSVITRVEHRPAILARRPELMVVDSNDYGSCVELLEKASVVIVGPGLGRSEWGHALLKEAVTSGKPMVLDADGLHGFVELSLRARGPLIITPHNAEAAALLKCDVAEVQSDRLGAIHRLVERVGGTAVLKGVGTLIASEISSDKLAKIRTTKEVPAGAEDSETRDKTRLLGCCMHGNPGMATAGMGDVLSGVIGGLLAQKLSEVDAAVLGVCLHGYAGDRAAERMGQRGLLATDLLPFMVDALKVSCGE